MATFTANGRITFTMEISTPRDLRVVTICDDGWKIWFKDPDNNDAFLYSISLGTDSTRRADRETALQIIGERCGWWLNPQDLFTDAKPPTYFPI